MNGFDEIPESIMGVYYIRNIINEKLYIGSSINIRRRMQQHLSTLRNNKHHNQHLQNSYNKYGENNFECGIITECFEEEFDEDYTIFDVEQDAIDYFKAYDEEFGYNIVRYVKREEHIFTEQERLNLSDKFLGENNPFYGKKHSEESKEKMRIAKIGKEINEKQRAALELGRGKDHWTQETYDKLNKIAKDRRGHMSNSKLKKEDIIEIIHEIIKGTKQGDIAKKFGAFVFLVDKTQYS